jgi:triacylglycerol lipase
VLQSARQTVAAALGEFRAGWDFIRALASQPDEELPHGDGRPVLLIPGFWGSDGSLFVLRRNLAHLGYDARSWGMGTNNRCGEKTAEMVEDKVRRAAEKADQRLTLIGHSRGGFIAREVARRVPDMIDLVITLGTPIRGQSVRDASLMVQALMVVSRNLFAERQSCMTENCDCQYVLHFGAKLPPQVTAYSLWSRDDAVVVPEQCIAPGEPNIEVHGSHVGMVASAEVLAIIARLLQSSSSARAG